MSLNYEDGVLTPLYETREIWAEEGGAANANNAEFSYGNGATGFMGLIVGEGWEIFEMYFMADTYAATATIQIDAMNYGNVASNATANTLTSISLNSSTDGGGATNNARKLITLSPAVPIPISAGSNSTILGFITRGVTGSISDIRVGMRIRKQTGNYLNITQ